MTSGNFQENNIDYNWEYAGKYSHIEVLFVWVSTIDTETSTVWYRNSIIWVSNNRFLLGLNLL